MLENLLTILTSTGGARWLFTELSTIYHLLKNVPLSVLEAGQLHRPVLA
jgi:hypothetical protein